MKKQNISLMLVLVMLLASASLGLAQGSVNAWSSVQGIPVDERVIVKRRDGKTIEGRMTEANETTLTISRKNQVVNISRAEIREIYQIKGKAAKAKWAAIGAGVGANAGTGIGAAKYSPNRDNSEIFIAMGLLLVRVSGPLWVP